MVFIVKFWTILTQMSPYLLLGFLIAGLLKIIFKKDFIFKHIGQNSLSSIIKASLIGVPMPVCSCGVVPLAHSLKSNGASKGAIASFVTSTPQTGVDSIMVTYSFLGFPLTLLRVIMAFISGIISGTFVEKWGDDNDLKKEHENNHTDNHQSLKNSIIQAFKYSLISLPADIGFSLILGIAISALISILIPVDTFKEFIGKSYLEYLIALLLSIPIYVCSTGSVPIALGLIHLGLSKGAALVFLIAGPATNMSTILALSQVMGKRSTAIYTASIMILSVLTGVFFNSLFDSSDHSGGITHTDELHLFSHICSFIILVLIISSKFKPVHHNSKN